MRRRLRENGLSLFFGTILILALAGQAIAGLAEYNQQQLTAGLQPTTLGHYLLSSDFAVDVADTQETILLERNHGVVLILQRL